MEEKKLVDLHYSTNHHNFKTLCNEDKKNNTRKLLKFKISDPTILDSVYNVFVSNTVVYLNKSLWTACSQFLTMGRIPRAQVTHSATFLRVIESEISRSADEPRSPITCYRYCFLKVLTFSKY